MKTLENILTIEGGHTATLVKRNDKAAIYKRETAEGQFVSFEVFAIMSKDGMEVYPNQAAVRNRWCVCPMTETKAETWFDRFTNGDVTIPNVDPVTGDPVEATDNRSLDELPDVVVAVDEPAPTTVAVEVPVVTEPVVDEPAPVAESTDSVPVVDVPVVEDPTAPDDVPVVEVPEVTPTVDGGVAVTVATVKAKKVYLALNLPAGEWTRTDFANLNGLKPCNSESYGALMREVKAGRVVELRKESSGRGKPRSIYSAVPVPTPLTV